MRRVLWVVLFFTLAVLSPAGTNGVAAPLAEQPAAPSESPPAQSAPTCTTVCDKAGVNFAVPVQLNDGDFDHAQHLGMGWTLALARQTDDVRGTVRGIYRAADRGMNYIIVPHCGPGDCIWGESWRWADFLEEVDAQVDVDFWAMVGPVEPNSLSTWAGSTPEGVANYMNAVLRDTADLSHLRTLSPSFNLLDEQFDEYFAAMEAAGANFAQLDALAATSYTIAGNGAYYYYAANPSHSETMRDKVERYGLPFIFTEYGGFDMVDHLDEGDPARVQGVAQMKSEFAVAARDFTVTAILLFNAFGHNKDFIHHRFYDSELVDILSNSACEGGGYNVALTSPSPGDVTLWQLPDELYCREYTDTCPPVEALACPANGCVDNDGDGLPGEGGAASCVRIDCDDRNPDLGLSCGGDVPDAAAGWGILRTIQTGLASSEGHAAPSVRIRADGLPVIAYHDGNSGRGTLNVLACNSPDCGTALRQVLVSENQLDGTYLSMQIGADGAPAIAHIDRTINDLEFYTCSDPGCASGQNQTLDRETGFGDFDTATSTAIRADGRPIVAYWHTDALDLRAFDCVDAACTSGSVRELDTDPMTGYYPSIVIGADGNPLIAYHAFDDAAQQWQLRLYRCTDPGCSGGGFSVIAVPAESGISPDALLVRPDDLPLLVYRTASGLMLYDCAAPGCADGTQRQLYAGEGIGSASLALLPDGSPFVAFSVNPSGADNDLVLLRCLDPACATSVTDTTTAGNAGVQPDVAVRPDGQPLVVFHDVSNSSLVLYDVRLTDGSGSPPPLSQSPSVPSAQKPPGGSGTKQIKGEA